MYPHAVGCSKTTIEKANSPDASWCSWCHWEDLCHDWTHLMKFLPFQSTKTYAVFQTNKSSANMCRRLNVAITRAKRGLIVVRCSWHHIFLMWNATTKWLCPHEASYHLHHRKCIPCSDWGPSYFDGGCNMGLLAQVGREIWFGFGACSKTHQHCLHWWQTWRRLISNDSLYKNNWSFVLENWKNSVFSPRYADY